MGIARWLLFGLALLCAPVLFFMLRKAPQLAARLARRSKTIAALLSVVLSFQPKAALPAEEPSASPTVVYVRPAKKSPLEHLPPELKSVERWNQYKAVLEKIAALPYDNPAFDLSQFARDCWSEQTPASCKDEELLSLKPGLKETVEQRAKAEAAVAAELATVFGFKSRAELWAAIRKFELCGGLGGAAESGGIISPLGFLLAAQALRRLPETESCVRSVHPLSRAVPPHDCRGRPPSESDDAWLRTFFAPRCKALAGQDFTNLKELVRRQLGRCYLVHVFNLSLQIGYPIEHWCISPLHGGPAISTLPAKSGLAKFREVVLKEYDRTMAGCDEQKSPGRGELVKELRIEIETYLTKLDERLPQIAALRDSYAALLKDLE